MKLLIIRPNTPCGRRRRRDCNAEKEVDVDIEGEDVDIEGEDVVQLSSIVNKYFFPW